MQPFVTLKNSDYNVGIFENSEEFENMNPVMSLEGSYLWGFKIKFQPQDSYKNRFF